MKQTALDILFDQIKLKADSIPTNTAENRKVKGAYVDCLTLIREAKEMERKLIKDSCTMAIMQWHEWDKTNYLDLYDHKIEGAEIWSEDYVKELYGEIEVPEPNKAMELFNDYTSYCQYVKEEWNDGYINELFESGYIVEKEYIGEYECASRDIEYRMLTESEFNETFNQQ
jgi:hypothetical protein